MINSIKALRANKDLTQEQAAALIGIHGLTYRSYEQLKTRIPFDTAVIMARLFDVKIEELNEIIERQKRGEIK